MKPSSFAGLFVTLLLAACGSGPASTADAPPTTTRATEAPTAAPLADPTDAPPTAEPAGQPADPRAAIGAALEALDLNGPYRMVIRAANDAEGPVVLDVVPPDRSWYRASFEGTPVEVINIGNTAYVLDPDGTWQTSTSTDSSTESQLLDPASLAALTDIKVLPPETLAGTLTSVYSFVDPDSPEATVTLWVSQGEGRLVQMMMESIDDVVVYEITYDASITVAAPVP